LKSAKQIHLDHLNSLFSRLLQLKKINLILKASLKSIYLQVGL